ncbi:hypothetical protein GCK72_006078 [Caenorhabditis remanei]|uniref:Uncharacterized protein n=2 Tax=Caenorhabditis remanei TaxID=31234 RepID=E3M4S0_CAERE|nr:hypothetical protein GCK72_006078 [Caenorhabditis remanei]EFO91463.1 hypothetical protein CRE_11966 [Caenorhabditis remanei]KAF1766122.1 hypothetical protein GCK72_006078 [Caenorhabditis remanei]
MDHSTRFRVHNWLRSRRKLFQSRMCLLMLVMINFVNSVILTLEICGEDSNMTLLMFFVNTFVVFLSMYGLYNFRPVFLSPNVLLKIILSSSALFYGLQMAETTSNSAIFVWLTISIVFFILEIHTMFSTTFDIIKQLNLRAYSKPPPNYNQVMSIDIPPPSYEEALVRIQQNRPAQVHNSPKTTENQQPTQLNTCDLAHLVV